MRTHTYNQGAADERAIWIRKVRALVRRDTGYVQPSIMELLAWGKKRAERCAKKPGGIGRK